MAHPMDTEKLQDDVYSLIRLRDHGGLIPTSAGLIRIICEAERQLRNYMSIQSVNHRISPLHLKLAVQGTMNKCDVLDMADHASQTQTGIENHHDILIENIIALFHRSRIWFQFKSMSMSI